MLARWITALFAGALALGCRGTPARAARSLSPNVTGWLPENRARIDAMLAARGRASAGYDPAHPPVATFDWDNTVMRNDVGDATMAWMLLHDAILQPPNRDWARTSEALTKDALGALHAACDGAGEPGSPLATSRVSACADEILAIYSDGKTTRGEAAWTREITRTTKESYAWEARLLGGHTPDEVRAIARAAYREDSTAAIGAVRTIGSRRDVPAWVRVYEPMRDLIGALQGSGFDVWIVSASPQHVSEIVAAEVGVAADHVVGVRTTRDGDRLGYDLESCGGAPKNRVMTYDQGKRCWINRAIFGLPERDQLRRAEPRHRSTFAAGDSDTDVAFVQDATELKLVIDRHRPAIMCNALANFEQRWIVQPMFIEPMPSAEVYACATTLDAEGARIVDEAGREMVDQRGR